MTNNEEDSKGSTRRSGITQAKLTYQKEQKVEECKIGSEKKIRIRDNVLGLFNQR
jgi:hypothetical protein